MPIVKSKKEESDSMHPPGDDQFSPQKPKFSFNDLVLSDLIRNEIMDVLSIQQLQSHVFDTWGLAHTHKLQKKIALNFYGEPGTGKTMAAHAVAHYLDKDIIEVNYADIESKYVGDTPKNLTRVFKKAKETKIAVIKTPISNIIIPFKLGALMSSGIPDPIKKEMISDSAKLINKLIQILLLLIG